MVEKRISDEYFEEITYERRPSKSFTTSESTKKEILIKKVRQSFSASNKRQESELVSKIDFLDDVSIYKLADCDQNCVRDLIEEAFLERKKYLEGFAFYYQDKHDTCSNIVAHAITEKGEVIPVKQLAEISEIQKVKIFYDDRAIYIGDIKGGKRHGKGEMKFESGERYNGEWKEDLMDGEGTYTWLDDTKYKGRFKQGMREGKNGEYDDPQGLKYKGEFFADKFYGFGEAEWADGRSYQGGWKDGRQHGYGKFIFAKNSKFENYIGNWNEGQIYNEGRLAMKNGDTYEGEFEGNGIRHGFGEYIWYSAGLCYRGEWKDDLREGIGELVCKDGEAYEGSWKNDTMHGRGAIRLPTATPGKLVTHIGEFSGVVWVGDLVKCQFWGEFRSLSGARYKGAWERFRKHGKGESLDVDGLYIQGKFEEDKPTGKVEVEFPHLNGLKTCIVKNGKLLSADGNEIEFMQYSAKNGHIGKPKKEGKGSAKLRDRSIYEGEWKNGMPHGRGWRCQPNGLMHKGEFNNGQRHGKGQEILPDGTSRSGTWKEDSKEGIFIIEYANGIITLVEYHEDEEVENIPDLFEFEEEEEENMNNSQANENDSTQFHFSLSLRRRRMSAAPSLTMSRGSTNWVIFCLRC